MESLFFILPISVVKKIIKNIKDDDTYKNLRITSKSFHDIMPSVKSFYLDGVLKSSVKFFKGIPIGSYYYYSEDGYLLKSFPLSSNGIEGIVRFYENFRSFYTCNYINNKKNGTECFYYSNGRPYIETPFRCNLKNGRETIYYTNGIIKSKKNYKNGLLHGEVNFYLPNGNLKYTIQYHNGMINGEIITYFENSCPFVVCNIKNNKIYGRYEVYYINGTIKMTYNILNGKKHGICKVFYNNGNLKEIFKFKNGFIDGVYKSWYRNGYPCIVQNYKDGVLHGRKVFFDYQNNIKNIYNFDYLNGNLIKFTQFRNNNYSNILCFIYNDNNEMIGGKYSVFTSNLDIETDFDYNLCINNFIHKIDMRNNSYFKYYKNRHTDCFVVKKFSEKNFIYSITKIDGNFKVFNNGGKHPQKYMTNDLQLIPV